LNTLIDDDELNIDIHDLDPIDIKKYVGESQDKMKTMLQEYKQLQERHDTLENQYGISRLDWKDNQEWKNMEQEVNRCQKFMNRCKQNGIII